MYIMRYFDKNLFNFEILLVYRSIVIQSSSISTTILCCQTFVARKKEGSWGEIIQDDYLPPRHTGVTSKNVSGGQSECINASEVAVGHSNLVLASGDAPQ